MSDPVDQFEVERLLKCFARLGAHDHPLDWERFYQFVASSHRHAISWDADEVQARLEGHGMPVETAKEFAEIYWHARCVMHRYDSPGDSRGSYADWIGREGVPLT